jgi:hypothetical protein
LAVIMAVLLPCTAWGQTPTVFEPGFFIEEYEHCTEITETPGYNTPVVKAAACGPGGAWGTGLYVGAHTYTQGLVLLLDPPNLAATVRTLGDLDDLSIADMDFAPLGWRGGDLLYVTIRDGMQPNRSTGAWGLDASGDFVDTFMIHSFLESIRKLAIDPTGTFGDDIFFWFGTTLYRRDAAGSLTTIPGATGIGALAFGPGGPWTSDLYTQNVIVAPDGSIRPSPVHLEGTWAHGPGFEGDLFTLCNVGQTCRVKPDGTRTLFGEGLGMNAVSCGGALWFFDRRDTGTCRAIRFFIAEATADFSPSSINLESSGTTFSIRTVLGDDSSGTPIHASLLGPAWISKIQAPSLGEILLPTPVADPGCNSALEDGLWETFEDRVAAGSGTVMLKFRLPSDGDCATRDGNRQTLIPLLLDVPDGETATVCYSAEHPAVSAPVSGCGPLVVINRGNR